MKSLTRRCASLLLVLYLLAGLTLPAVRAVPAEEGEITISSVRDLLDFAGNCSLDTWSQGRTVRLTANLDLGGQAFIPIPTFGGTFLGEGHTISGLHISAAGSNMGLFRYLQEGAVVQNLTVSGVVRPEGSAVNVGGIVGNNAGAVRDCWFSGTVEGSSAVGGIAGVNRETGEIARAITSGVITAEEFTGGTAGKNLGALLQCENGASVNTATPERDIGVDMDALASSLENATAADDEDGFLKVHSDTGGIAGYSSGIVYSCLNTGTIGYPHVGYNVGGVAGRQNGHLSGCTNRGQVYGRKDVGGIVGQAEPDVALSSDSGTLERLRRELEALDSLIDRALNRSEGNTDGISDRLSGMGVTTGAARDHTKDLLDHLSDFTDENVSSINSLSAAVTKALSDLTPALDELSGVSGRMETLAKQLEDALDALDSAAENGGDTFADAGLAAGIFRRAGEALTAAVRDLRSAVTALQSAVVVHDQAAVDAAAADMSAALVGFGSAMDQAGQAVDALKEALGSFPELQGVREVLEQQLAPALSGMGSALRQAGTALKTINANTGLDWGQLRAALREAGAGFGNLEIASERLNGAIGALQTVLEGLGSFSGQLGRAIGELADAAALAAPVGRGLERAFDILKRVTEDLAEDGSTQFTPLGEAARDAGRGIFDSLSDLSQELEELHEAVSEAGDQLSADLRAISRQFNTVFQVLLDALTDVRDNVDGSSREILEDTSDENIAATQYGKIENCRNEGAVDGDRNVGGIAGDMSIEFDLDPEGDLELSLGSTYETKAILQGSVNYGAVTAKKDCAGGAAGRMDLGTVLNCENYGSVESTSGGYVGGIAGLSDGMIRESCAKCTLSGGSDVGGIAGQAGRLRSCYAIATVLEGTERVGAVAGGGELADIRDNFFVDTGTAGVDGVSYAGAAEPIAYEDLRQNADLPAAFTAFTLTLLAEERVIKEIPFTYGEDLSRIALPAAPEREGFYGTWPDFDTSGLNSDITLEAVYTPWVTLVASGAQEGRLALALAEGQFTEEASLSVKDSAQAPPAGGSEDGVWEISLSGTELTAEDQVPLRLLNRTGGRAAVWQYENGVWRRVEARTNGSYLCLTMTGTSGLFCVAPAGNGGTLPAVLAAAGALILLAVFLRRRRKTRTADKNAGAQKKKTASKT